MKYSVNGDKNLGKMNSKLQADKDIKINNLWGIYDWTWTILVHIFLKAATPIVQLPVNSYADEEGIYNIGKKLEQLMENFYLILDAANIADIFRESDWLNPVANK